MTSSDITESLARIGRLAYTTDSPKPALHMILDEIVSRFPCASASIALIDPYTRKLAIEAHHGLPDAHDGFQLSLTEGVTGWVAMHGRPLIIPDVTKDGRYVNLRDNVRSEMAAPLEDDQQIHGVINLDSDETDTYTQADLDALIIIAREATLVIKRLWQVTQLRTKSEHLESLIKTGQSIVSQHELKRILENITDEARRLMNCKVCAIFMHNEEEQSLKLETLSGVDKSIDYSEELQLGDSTLGVAIARGKQIEVINLPHTEEHHFVPIIQKENLLSLLSTPIIAEGEAIGVLNAYTGKHYRFNNDERQLMQALASLGGVAIHNAQLYSRIFSSEESLRQSERLTTLGLMAAEIAHEIRNPLTVVKLLFQSLDLGFDDGDPRNKDITVITEKLQQLEDTVGNVLNFAKSKHTLHSIVQLNGIIEDTMTLVRLKLDQHSIDIRYEQLSGNMEPNANKGQLQQTLLNLILNSIDAMPNGGSILIRTEEMDDKAVIYFSDTGGGIPDKIKPHIFESFLSGKHEGSGLGLGIVKRIMKSHRGDIELLESSASGTTFKLWLPLNRE